MFQSIRAPIATWFRVCLTIAALFNFCGTLSFMPPLYNSVAPSLGLPTQISPFGFWVLATWILIFGIAYAWLALNPQPQTLFVAVAAACKIAIAIFFFIFWFTDDLPIIALLIGSGDLFLGITFVVWLLQTR
ncbi:hypothetical protein [Leptolyngbya sp. FACHB-16]|uniref:hypothetical protein n=1 Tax=unclassified Leptolyngbya TaxID=2650499 RepID=UPI0016890A02|nr:hypothetical protein [Leptolyngbya sp. FACHB-16]MBD2157038.1 hypothetical protein [Leptolyngbya sp. FACHB-16]